MWIILPQKKLDSYTGSIRTHTSFRGIEKCAAGVAIGRIPPHRHVVCLSIGRRRWRRDGDINSNPITLVHSNWWVQTRVPQEKFKVRIVILLTLSCNIILLWSLVNHFLFYELYTTSSLRELTKKKKTTGHIFICFLKCNFLFMCFQAKHMDIKSNLQYYCML